jgi:hypothetical protein
LDFNEAYMSALARDGRGNFAFVNDAAGLSAFLHRELDEASNTTVERATVRLTLPRGLRFVRADGVDARAEDGAIVLKMGALFAGDERRGIVELAPSMEDGEKGDVQVEAAWQRVGFGGETVRAPDLSLAGTRDAEEVAKGKDTTVLADATSLASSQRQLEATYAYANGDQEGAQKLIAQNIAALQSAAAVAPAPLAAKLAKQSAAYSNAVKAFAAAPSSDDGKRAAKSAAANESSHLARDVAY